MSFITNRKKTRKLLFQMLFYKTFQKLDLEDFYGAFYTEAHSFQKDDAYINSMLKITEFYESFFIYVIKKFSPKFNFEQMTVMNIIPVYIALSEIFFMEEEFPIKVSLNEGIEMAKVYGGDSSKKIVNGILNSVSKNYKELEENKEVWKDESGYSIFEK